MKSLLIMCLAVISALGVTFGTSKANAGEVEKRVACKNQVGGKNSATAVNGREPGRGSFANGREGSQSDRGFNENGVEGRNRESGETILPPTFKQRWGGERRLLSEAIESLERLAQWDRSSWRTLRDEELNQDSRGAPLDVLAPLRKEILWLERVLDSIFQFKSLLKEREDYISSGCQQASPQ